MIEKIALEKPRAKRILLVDFELTEVRRLRFVLKTAGIQPSCDLKIANGQTETEELFVRWHPDLLLIRVAESHNQQLDAKMIRLLRTIRTLEGDRHVGIITIGSGGVTSLEYGADDFLELAYDSEELKARLRAALRLKTIHDELRIANHRLHTLSLTDELTGLGNMRDFTQKYTQLMARCRLGELAFGIVMLDLDYFKSVNDQTNHLFGSFVLSEVGRILKSASDLWSRNDFLARYGGDEFIAVIIGPHAEVRKKSERIRQLICQHHFVRQDFATRVTASIGLAWVPPHYADASEEAIKAADLMLYKSKENGRNCVSDIVLKSQFNADLFNQTSSIVAGKSLVDRQNLSLIQGGHPDRVWPDLASAHSGIPTSAESSTDISKSAAVIRLF